MPTVEAFQKQDPGAGTDTAHADNLARHIHQSVLLENVSSVCRQGFSVGRENASQLGKQLLSIRVREELGHTNYQRRVAHNPWLAIHDGRESLCCCGRHPLGDSISYVALIWVGWLIPAKSPSEGPASSPTW